ncbi:unnamed protein product [Chondrus crispus]|uniref:Uncharacterized protein n=1 Tax=Chondrus crispus TaxID=2769 RepID=S0F3V0_CHOCR|nr:unnamed protein product [Chondrus crispus]CDF77468.1 unnamed protein product [Chondrus crispus]|eukprot:XP_005712342.1 unnamed protein product [Chondrus crispus]
MNASLSDKTHDLFRKKGKERGSYEDNGPIGITVSRSTSPRILTPVLTFYRHLPFSSRPYCFRAVCLIHSLS